MRSLVGLMAVLAWTGISTAADVKTSEITFSSGKEQVKGFLAVPEGKGPFPGVVVIQEWWGLNDWVKEQAQRLAKQGYVALAPDLYRGKVATDPTMARKLMMGLPRDRALRDLKGAVDYLVKQETVNKDRIGCIGWCMGGGYALQASLEDSRIDACVICYGRVVTDPDTLKSLNATVLGIFGKEDRGIPIETVREFGKALKKADRKVEAIHEYDAGHGFMRDANKNPEYKPDATKAAWKAIEQFFAKTLKGK